MDYTVDIYNSLFRNYITYDRLFQMNTKAFYGKTNAVHANIFIDIRSFVNSLFKNSGIRYEYKDKQTPIASSLINLAIHLKHYYRTRHHTEIKIFLVWGANTISMLPKSSDYNAHNNMAFSVNNIMREILQNSLELLKTLCPYLPGVYYVDVGICETAMGIQSLIDYPDKSGIYRDVPNIIYSKDPYLSQLVATNSFTFMFYYTKHISNNGMSDASYIIEKKNLYEAFSVMNKYTTRTMYPTNMSNFRLVLSLSGMKCRHISGPMSYTNACKLIAKYEELIPYNADPMLMRIILDEVKLTPAERNAILDDRILGIDSEINVETNKVVFAVSRHEFVTMFDGCIDLYSPDDIKRINDKYFLNYPLDIMRL